MKLLLSYYNKNWSSVSSKPSHTLQSFHRSSVALIYILSWFLGLPKLDKFLFAYLPQVSVTFSMGRFLKILLQTLLNQQYILLTESFQSSQM